MRAHITSGGRCIGAPGLTPPRPSPLGKRMSIHCSLLSVHPCVFHKCPNPLLNCQKHFFSPPMRIFYSAETVVNCFMNHFFLFPCEEPFLPMRSEPLPDSVFDSNLPSPAVPKDHPFLPQHSLLPPIASTSVGFLSTAISHKETKFCHFAKVTEHSAVSKQPGCLELQALRGPLGFRTSRVGCLTPDPGRAV